MCWMDNVGWDGVDWIGLAQDRGQWRTLVNAVMNLRISRDAGKSPSNCTAGGLSRRAQLHGVGHLYGATFCSYFAMINVRS
jgi:hypothetical protein